MAKTIATIIITLLLIHFLAIAGFLGYGAMTGRFDGEKRAQYLATWRGEKLVAPTEEIQTAQAEEEAPQPASARIETKEAEKEIAVRQVERELELLRNMRFTLDVLQRNLNQQKKELEEKEAAFAGALETERKKMESEGFRKALQDYSSMKSKYAKNDLMKMEDAEAVRYLSAMKPDVATRILNQFKTPQEQEKRMRLLKQLKDQNVAVVEAAAPKQDGGAGAGM